MENKYVTVDDFVYDAEDSFFTHNETGFMLDGEFVLLFEDETVVDLFNKLTNCHMNEETLNALRQIVVDSAEEVE